MSLAVTLVVHDIGDGAVARAHSLTMALEHLGHRPRTVSTRGQRVWTPLAGTAYGERCAVLDEAQLSALVEHGTDLLLAVKPLPGSLGTAIRLARRHGVPLMVDVDDPDVEVRTTWQPPRALLHQVRTRPGHVAELLRLGRAARRLPSTVSNPWLRAMYGGTMVPHARDDRGAGRPHTSTRPTVAFIGSVRAHKGLPLLREAVARLAPEGWTLVVTADAPADARPWERWAGTATPGHPLLVDSDVVVIPSEPVGYGPAQLPMKLVDAMMAARAVVVSDVGPLGWAAGPAAPLFRAGDVDSLVRALRPLADPEVRARAGAALRAEALARYAPGAVAPVLAGAVQRALHSAERAQRVRSALVPRLSVTGLLRAPRRPSLLAEPVGH